MSPIALENRLSSGHGPLKSQGLPDRNYISMLVVLSWYIGSHN